MFGHPIHLVRRAIVKQRTDGFRSLLGRVRHHLITKHRPFPSYIPPLAITYKNNRYALSHKDKYIYIHSSPKVTPEAGDTVVEAGVCRGLDTAMFAKLADKVIGFEPSPRNYEVAQDNLSGFSNVMLVNAGLWNESDTLEVQYGRSGSDDGFLVPDSGVFDTGGSVSVNTLKHYMESLDIESVDFLKVEAEGSEPEIIDGIEGIDIKHIVVNCGEERDGEPVGSQVMQQLHRQGYELVAVKKGHILFFTSEEILHAAFRDEFA